MTYFDYIFSTPPTLPRSSHLPIHSTSFSLSLPLALSLSLSASMSLSKTKIKTKKKKVKMIFNNIKAKFKAYTNQHGVCFEVAKHSWHGPGSAPERACGTQLEKTCARLVCAATVSVSSRIQVFIISKTIL